MRTAYIVQLNDPMSRSLDVVGGKAASLSRLKVLPVPQMAAFCVTTRAYFEQLKRFDISYPKTLAGCQALRRRFLKAPFPVALMEELEENLAVLKKTARFRPFRVAIRSSASSEDLPTLSFAGQHDTFLNISGVDDVVEAIVRCWASFWSPRAFFYRQKNKIDHYKAGMAVLVQEMVPAEISGTLFTVNPVSADRKEFVIEAVRGLGESLVGGKTTPYTYYVPKGKGALRAPKIHGTSLAKRDIRVLTQAGSKIERLYKSPMDIEWAKSGRNIFILQARPITTMDKSPLEWVFCVKKRLSWTSEMLQAEGQAGRYFREVLGVDWEFKNAKMAAFCEYCEAKESAAFDELVSRLALRPARLRAIAGRSYRECDRFQKLGELLAATSWGRLSRRRVLRGLRVFHRAALRMIPIVYFLPNLDALIKVPLREHLKRLGEESRLEEYFLLLTSTTDSLTVIKEQRDLLEIGALIQSAYPELARRISLRGHGRLNLPKAVLLRLRAHERAYSWINTDDMFGWAWTMEDFIKRLGVLLRENCVLRLKSALERQVARESAHKAALKKLKLRGRLLELVSIARKNSHLRTHRVEVYVRTFHQASSLIEAVAVKLGLNRKDTLYLSFDEMEAMLSRKLSPDSIDLRERKMGMAYIMKNRQVQTFFGEAAKRMAMPDEEEASKTSPVVRGTAANLGKARGVVRVVHDISELHKVRQGDILVASMTIPEFAPAMEKAAAFVTDEGGITCHAAIISREMGVPCLIGTRNGTKILRDGERVEVDAFRAVVRRLASSTSG